jgi:hypothetical protein
VGHTRGGIFDFQKFARNMAFHRITASNSYMPEITKLFARFWFIQQKSFDFPFDPHKYYDSGRSNNLTSYFCQILTVTDGCFPFNPQKYSDSGQQVYAI